MEGNLAGRDSNIPRYERAEFTLTGFIPPELGNLENLLTLNLSQNALRSSIPSSLGKLSKLRKLHNMLGGGGGIPNELADIKNLTELVLKDNGLRGSIPLGLFNLTNLEVLSLASNVLTGIVPAAMAKKRGPFDDNCLFTIETPESFSAALGNNNDGNNSAASLPVAAIAGGIVGGIVLIAVVAVAAVVMRRRRASATPKEVGEREPTSASRDCEKAPV
ncbi:hypothetical protein HDU96_006480 [Phlyctochytrium bullatum]|nr:hypothetical protein HDU96_006480 [Phlyctochytrium bullatum]